MDPRSFIAGAVIGVVALITAVVLWDRHGQREDAARPIRDTGQR